MTTPQVLLLLLLFHVELIATDLAIEELKLPYDLYIYGENATGHLTLSNRKPIDRDWNDIEEFARDTTKKTDIEVLIRLTDEASKEETAPANSLLLKTTGGHPVLITISPNLNASQNGTHFSYEALAFSKTPPVEIFELLLQTFAKGTHFSVLDAIWGDTSSTTNAVLEAIIASDKKIRQCYVRYGKQSPPPDLISKFVDTVKPVLFSLTIALGLTADELTGPRLQLPDSFFQSAVVRNISQLHLAMADAEISDESLGRLSANTISVRGAPKLTGKGLLQWLQPVFDGDAKEKSLVVSESTAKTMIDGLVPLVDHVLNEGGSMTITHIKNGAKTLTTNLKFDNLTEFFNEPIIELTAESSKGASEKMFLVVFLCVCIVFFHNKY